MWYTTKVVPEVENAARELAVYMSHPGMGHCKSLVRLIDYLKGKDTKVIVIIKPKVMKAIMFCDSDYATEKDTIGGTLLTYFSKTQSTVTLSSTEEKYMALSAFAK